MAAHHLYIERRLLLARGAVLAVLSDHGGRAEDHRVRAVPQRAARVLEERPVAAAVREDLAPKRVKVKICL